MSQMTMGAAVDARSEQRRRARPARKLLVSAVGLVIAAAVVVPLAVRDAGHPAPPNGIGSLAGEATYDGLTLRFPATWHAVQPTFLTGAMMYPLGWITNAEPGPQCTTQPAGNTGCHGPVTHLGSGVVQISLRTGGGNVDFTRHLVINSRIAGLPAQRMVSTIGCDRSAKSGFSVIAAETRTSVIGLTACFGPNTSVEQDQVRSMLTTATYRHP